MLLQGLVRPPLGQTRLRWDCLKAAGHEIDWWQTEKIKFNNVFPKVMNNHKVPYSQLQGRLLQ